MAVLQIIYSSKACDSVDQSEVLDILRSSQIRNQQDGISGLLIYQPPRFVQMLEGPAAEAQALYERIMRDPRHTDIELIDRREVEHAAMPTWAMGYFSPLLLGDAAPSDPFVFDELQIRSICAALPPYVSAPFLSALGG